MSARAGSAQGHSTTEAVTRIVEALLAPGTARHFANAQDLGAGPDAPVAIHLVLHGPAAARLILSGIDAPRVPKAYVDSACLSEASWRASLEGEIEGDGIVLSTDVNADTDLDFSDMFSSALHHWAEVEVPGKGVVCHIHVPEPAWMALHLAETHRPEERAALAQLIDRCDDGDLSRTLNLLGEANGPKAGFKAASHFLKSVRSLAQNGEARARRIASELELPSRLRNVLSPRPDGEAAMAREPGSGLLKSLLQDIPKRGDDLVGGPDGWAVEEALQWLPRRMRPLAPAVGAPSL